MYRLPILILTVFLVSCEEGKEINAFSPPPLSAGEPRQTKGFIERLSPEIDAIIPEKAEIEVLANALVWSEGPLWIAEKQWLLSSDVKENRIYRWSEKGGLEIYLEPAGFTGVTSNSRERGSNGLTLDPQGNLVMCQHGDRRVSKMNASLFEPEPSFVPIATHYDGRRLNSPNDLVYDRGGNLYFTDPPFGLSDEMMNDPEKELPFQGVYKVDLEGEITLLTDAVSRPNGLAFSPDEKTLYVSNTDEQNAAWYAFPVMEDRTLGKPVEIYNATHVIGEEVGFPDGIKVDDKGNIFTAGPGGLWIFSADHKLIGKIKPSEWVSNCAFDEDFTTLFITADDYLLRVKLRQSQ